MDLSAISPTLLIASRTGRVALGAIQAFQGVLLFFLLAVDVLTNFRVRFGKKEIAA